MRINNPSAFQAPSLKSKGRKEQAFTLVELIVVITILAILGTIAFISLQGYSRDARDSKRISDINNIKTSLDVFEIKTGKYPKPDNSQIVTFSGVYLWDQGTIGDNVTINLKTLNEKPVDPVFLNEYTYSISNVNNKYNLGAILESSIVYNNFLIDKANAGNNIAFVTGNYSPFLQKIQVILNSKKFKFNFPSIILSDLNEKQINVGQKTHFVVSGEDNLPSSYSGKGLTMTGTYSYSPKLLEQKLGMYYAWPSSLNPSINNWDIPSIINDFNKYDSIVLGKGLEQVSHDDHANTVDILAGYSGSFYGYVTLNQLYTTITASIDLWKATGAKGIFIDEAGYDFLVNGLNPTQTTEKNARIHQNQVIDYIRSKGLKIIFNAWNVDDIFGTIFGEVPIHLNNNDGYLIESFVYNTDIPAPYDDSINQVNRIKKIKSYINKYNFDSYCVGMLPLNSDIKNEHVKKIINQGENLCNYIQITNKFFSSQGIDNGKMIDFIN